VIFLAAFRETKESVQKKKKTKGKEHSKQRRGGREDSTLSIPGKKAYNYIILMSNNAMFDYALAKTRIDL
jgi:hypothetical protein